MRVLPNVAPTPEQLKIISQVRTGVEVIRGAAGSGKTTTAILRLRLLLGFFLNRRKQLGSKEPVRALVLTFNRTLRGYIAELIAQQAATVGAIEIDVDTFAHWAKTKLGQSSVLDNAERHRHFAALGNGLLSIPFLYEEVDYILSRYLPADRRTYLTSKREGRGGSPRVERPLREKLLTQVVAPYEKWKKANNLVDWFDMEVAIAESKAPGTYDIVIADEVQDFSANQVRAILRSVTKEHAITFVLDGAQRIYARGFTWAEVGVTVTSNNSFRLEVNYRNTRQIAAFAAPLLAGVAPDDADSTIPDFNKCKRNGPLPVIFRGKYSGQLRAAIAFIKSIDLQEESVAFLHPKGGGWFDTTRTELGRAKLDYVEISRESVWPKGPENIALSTISSAKGLEFDHVFLLGLNGDLLPHGAPADDNEWLRIRRLLAMGVGRAKKTVHLGFKPDPKDPDWLAVLDSNTYTEEGV